MLFREAVLFVFTSHCRPRSGFLCNVLFAGVGGGVYRFAASVGGVRAEEAGGERAEPPLDIGRLERQLGPRHSAHQHPLPERQTHARLRQRMARTHRVQNLSGIVSVLEEKTEIPQ